MIIQNGHNFFGATGNNNEGEKEPKSFLAHLQANIESSLTTTTTTTETPRVNENPSISENVAPGHFEELERLSRIFGDKKVSTFYLHMIIVMSTFIVLLFFGITAYFCYKR